jgi:serine/threonine-protein kinase
MALAAGSSLGSYQIVSALGAGGMGEVYRARDTRLGRDVAIKILPDAFVADPERVARFEREAQLLAALNHPHIAAIYGLEETGPAKFLVLELVDGESLAQKLEGIRGSGLGISEALEIARQIVEALEAAHEKAIIHRDLKPANIMLTADGHVKVLDFGLAKAMVSGAASGSAGPGGLTHSPTLTFAATQAGMVLGTAAYMSPEQARGRSADKRSDIWAFGCVLFEMLTGRRAFDGEDATDVIAAVVRGEPDWSALPADLPLYISTLLKRCLEKDRKVRIADVAVLRYVMAEGAGGDRSAHPVPPAGARRIQPSALIAGGLTIAAIAAATTWLAMRQTPGPTPPIRFSIVPPAGQALQGAPSDRNLAISSDGRYIVYVGGSNNQLLVRALDRLDAVALPGITGARSPFLSPDGRWIGFFATAELRKVSMSGGPPITVCRLTGAPRGASWGLDDTIVFATGDPSTGLLTVPAAGGEPKELTKPDTAHGEGDHILPAVLPAGRGVLFTIVPRSPVEGSTIAVLDLKTNQKKFLIRGGSQGEYVESGHLVYGAADTLRAVRFDLGHLEGASDPLPVVEHVSMGLTGASNYAISRSGALVYAPGALQEGRSLVWLDRQGHEEPIPAPQRPYAAVRLSPDGTRVALDVRDQEQDIWIWELARQTLTRLTFDPGLDSNAVWTPDGQRIIFASSRQGQINLFWQPADGTGPAELLTKSPNSQVPHSITPDGTRVIFREFVPATAIDLELLTLDEKRASQPLLQAPGIQMNGEVSPDSRWLAYQSDESGRNEIYVRPFPNINGGRWQVSTSGGSRPVWAHDGRELFYLDANNLITAVAVQSSAGFRAGGPVTMPNAAPFVSAPYRTYDVSPDGKRFLLIKTIRDTTTESKTTPSMVVVLNWLEELKARVPSK